MLVTKGTQLYENHEPFFYFADTCWSAFTNITMDEWNYYLDYRANQGFTVIQINILSQWDASGSDLNLLPFPIKRNGIHYTYDYSHPNEDYFEHAREMVAAVRQHGLTPALVLLWSNYVPNTWASDMAINNPIPFNEIAPYVAKVTDLFKPYHPLYFVSGDTDFPTKETISYYDEAYRTAKKHDSTALFSFHIKGRLDTIPEEFLSQIDFFSYQSGHNLAGQATAYKIPMKLRKQGFNRPIINTEPCYEQISYSRNMYGRYSAKDVRKASWSSILSGANAGITYGAHGIWSWHRSGQTFGIVQGEGFDAPFDWRDALHFDGANDISFLKDLMSTYFTKGIFPVDELLKNEPSIRIATDIDKKRFAIYLPVNTKVDLTPLNLDPNTTTARVFDLDKRIETTTTINNSLLAQSRVEADSLIIIDDKNMGDNKNE